MPAHAVGPPARIGGTAVSNAHYAFGDSDSAAERLRLLAYIFAPEIRSFLAHVPPEP